MITKVLARKQPPKHTQIFARTTSLWTVGGSIVTVSTIQSSCPRASLDLLIRQIRNTLSSTADAVVFVFPAGVGRLAHSWVSCASATTFLLYTRYSFCPAIQIAVFPLLGFDLVALPRLPLVTASLILTLTKKKPRAKTGAS